MAANEVRVVEADSHQYHVEVVIDGSRLPTRHLASDLEAAEALAVRLASACRICLGRTVCIVMPAQAVSQCA